MKTKKYRFFSIIIVAVFLVTLYREYDTSETSDITYLFKYKTHANEKLLRIKNILNISQIMLQQNWELPPEQLIYLEPALAGLPTYSLHGKNVAKEDAISDVKFLFSSF